ncbi:MAG: orotate phosphoribosyltransferase [Acidobacteriota bacterium]
MSHSIPVSGAGDLSDLTGAILSRLRQAASLLLWEQGAVQVNAEEPFRLASGNVSPIYVDCRRVISNRSVLRTFTMVAGTILERHGADFDVIAGGETAGIPYAAVLAESLAKPLVYVRKKAKAYGTGSRVEGALAPGSKVLLVEDLITDGGSKLTFLDAIADAGASVSNVLVLFDRQQGGGDRLAERGVTLHAVTDRTTAFAVAGASGLISENARLSTDEYFRDPAAWHANRGYGWNAPS